MEDRSRHDNLRIGGLKDVENETWEQEEQILKMMIQEKLEIEDVNFERAQITPITPRQEQELPSFLVLKKSQSFFMLPKS